MPSRVLPGTPNVWGLRAALLSCVGALAFGCASVLGVDGEYELEESAQDSAGGRGSGGRSTAAGGAAASNGGAASGGAAGTGGGGGRSNAGGGAGAGGTGGCAGEADCEAQQKCCGGTCVTPSPEFGCALAECTPCPDPIPNAEAFCQEERCTGRCLPDFEPSSGACTPKGSVDAGSGGSPGAGGSTGGSGPTSGGAPGTGGGPAICTRETCPPCTNPLRGIIPCCERISNACGCSWFDPIYCVD